MNRKYKERKPCSHGKLSIVIHRNNLNGPLWNTCTGRASFSTFVCSASMTVEAALVLPVFIFFMAEILYIYDMIRLQSSMLAALHETGTQISEYAFYTRYGMNSLEDTGKDSTGKTDAEGDGGVSDLSGIMGTAASLTIAETFVRSSVNRYLGETWMNEICLDGGGSGISYLESSIMDGNDVVDLIADYRIKPFLALFGLRSFTAQSRYYGHAWVGYAIGSDTNTEINKSDDSEMVYVTPTGEVYHKDQHCTYLKPSIRTIDASYLDTVRSQDGSKYYACERCKPAASGSVVITKEGNRYHSSASCTAIERNTEAISLLEAQETRRACSKCGGE